MVFYLNHLSNDESFYDFNISFKKKLVKVDKNLIKFLLKFYSEKKDSFIEVPKAKLKTILQLDGNEEITAYLDKFMQTKVYYSFKDCKSNSFQGVFHILDSYFVQKETVVLVLSKEILLSFDNNNLFNRINLKCILDFECNNSIHIYLKLLNLLENKEEGSLDFYLEDLKELLELSNCYDRFYDLEKKVLEPIMEDLNTYSEYQVTFSKIKKNEGSSSKILGISIHYVNKKIKELRKQGNNLLSLVKNKVENFDLIYNIIFESLTIYGYDYVYNNLMFVNKKDSKKFDLQLIEALKENLGYIPPNNNIIIIEKFIKRPSDIHGEISKALVQLDLGNIIEDHTFISSFIFNIYNLRDGEKYNFESRGIKIEVLFNKTLKSIIKVSKTN